VLPELGADKVKQTTYVDFMLKLIGKKMKLENSNHKLLTLILTHGDSREKTLLEQAAKFKNSMNMKDIIQNYVDDLLVNLLPEDDFSLNEKVLITNDNIKKMVYDELSFLPIFRRVEKLKIYLNKTVRSEAKKVLSKLSDQFDKKIEDVMSRESDPETRRTRIVEMMAEKEETLNRIDKEAKNVTNRFINKIKRKDLITYYETLICDSNLLRKYCVAPADGLVLDYVAKASKEIFQKKHIEIEDLAAMVYLQKFLFGIDDGLDIKYVVIDEAQDFSDFQFFVLRDILKTDRFTILGDLSQGIHGYRSINSWDYIKHKIFTEEASYLTLEQSYRTTVEIMNFANEILSQSAREDIIFARPVVRHGALPNVVKCNKKNEVIDAVENQIRQYKENGFTTIAVISKTEHEAQIMQKKLFRSGEFSVTLMDEKVTHYNNDIVVIPSHLAKGLEFDAVIVFTIDEEYGLDELDIKLLYVAMTRPLHRLSVIHRIGTMPIIENLKENIENVM
ncbi:MAG: 3'-5' exonuclease, partial [Bacillota bacterium]|nr:3'-5' exonuclease [Bacillota bacterium]